VLNGEFTYSDASKRSRKTVAMIRYNDKNDNYKPALEYIEDRDSMLRFGIRETEIVAFVELCKIILLK
jgi:predicted phage tail protein